METKTSKLTSKYQATIPERVRKAGALHSEDESRVRVALGELFGP